MPIIPFNLLQNTRALRWSLEPVALTANSGQLPPSPPSISQDSTSLLAKITHEVAGKKLGSRTRIMVAAKTQIFQAHLE